MENSINNKKLIYIANARMPTERAHGWQIMKMCEAFTEAGVDLTLLVPRRWSNPFRGDPFDFYKVERKFKIVYLPCIDFLSFASERLSAILAFKVQAATFAISVFLYSLLNENRKFFDTSKYQRKGKDSLQTFFFTRDHFSGLFLSLAGKKVFFEIHDQPKPTWAMKTFLRHIQGLVTTNTWKGDKVNKIFGFPKDKILVAYNAVDAEQFKVFENKETCRSRLGISPDAKIVLYAGHLYKWKGVHTLAEAAKHLARDVKIIFVGGRDQDIKSFTDFINTNLGDFRRKIKIIGHKPHHEIPYYLRAADVVVVPNSGQEQIGRYETSPLKIFEYMAAGKPIVASDLPSIREILNEETAKLVMPDDPVKLAEGIFMLMTNPDYANRLSDNAQELVKQYSWNARTRAVLDFIKR